jgi:hypothetical protein
MSRAMVAGLLGAGLVVSPAQAQMGITVPVGAGPYDRAAVGVPTGAQIIDVRWSGDRGGEFTILAVLPEAFRRGGHGDPPPGRRVPPDAPGAR